MIPYIVGKLAPNSSHLRRGLVKYVLGTGFFVPFPPKTGTNLLHLSAPQSLNESAAELGRNPVSKHQIQPDYGDEQADAGRDG